MDVVAEICDLPVRLKTRGDESIAMLVDESGYRQTPSALTVEAVSAHLERRPDLIDTWFRYSEDKRTSSGWYVTERPAGTFEVGYYPSGERLSVTERVRACAEFIVREVGAIAG